MRYSNSYQERIELADGTAVELRAVRPTDKAALADGFAGLSAETRRRRFLSPRRALSDDELRFFTECDGVDHYAIVAVVGGDSGDSGDAPTGVGVARFVRAPDEPEAAELAIVIADAWQRRGIGQQLFERIVAAAAERRIDIIRGESLVENMAMRALLKKNAPGLATRAERGILQFRFTVPRREPIGVVDATTALLRFAVLTPVMAPIALASFCYRNIWNRGRVPIDRSVG
jgi:GNAT superfamily N-acetyltransferase